MTRTRAQRKKIDDSTAEITTQLRSLDVSQAEQATAPENSLGRSEPAGDKFCRSQIHPSSKKCCIIAIDYGTTFSSVAYTILSDHTTNLEKVTPLIVRRFPASNELFHKENDVPTVSLYFGRGLKNYLWGFEVAEEIGGPRMHQFSGSRQIELVKLLLSDEEHLEELQKCASEALTQSSITLHSAIADYLSALWKNATREIATSEGEDFFSNLRKEVVLSVPPGWKPKAVRLMQAAAEFAGLPPPHIVAEQEAAALAVLKAKGLNNEDFHVGDIFLVVDAGGGTVDLASYRLEQKRPFRVTEVSDATGRAFGSSLINDKFRKWFKGKLNPERPKYLKFSEKDFERLIQTATDAFEWKKRRFGDSNNGEIWFRVPDLKANRDGSFKNGMVIVARDLVASWFDGLISENIIPLVRDCILSGHKNANQPVETPLIKHILVVGGFSGSRYFQRKMTDAFRGNANDSVPQYHIDVLYSEEHHETTVSRGSVLRFLEPNFLTQRRLRTSYGVKQDEYYLPGVHDPALKVFDDHEKRFMVRDCVSWIYKSGNLLGQNHNFEDLPLYWTVDADYDFESRNEKFVCELYMSDEPEALDHLTITQMQRQNKHIEECRKLPADLSRIDVASLKPLPTKNGKSYFKIEYSLKASIAGVLTEWELVIPNLPGASGKLAQVNISAAFKPGEAVA